MESKIEEKLLSDFFLEMKAKDDQSQVPSIPQRPKRIHWQWWGSGIAAAVLLVLIFSQRQDVQQLLIKDQMTLSIYQNAEQGEFILEIEESATLDTWEPLTQSLLEDF